MKLIIKGKIDFDKRPTETLNHTICDWKFSPQYLKKRIEPLLCGDITLNKVKNLLEVNEWAILKKNYLDAGCSEKTYEIFYDRQLRIVKNLRFLYRHLKGEKDFGRFFKRLKQTDYLDKKDFELVKWLRRLEENKNYFVEFKLEVINK